MYYHDYHASDYPKERDSCRSHGGVACVEEIDHERDCDDAYCHENPSTSAYAPYVPFLIISATFLIFPTLILLAPITMTVVNSP